MGVDWEALLGVKKKEEKKEQPQPQPAPQPAPTQEVAPQVLPPMTPEKVEKPVPTTVEALMKPEEKKENLCPRHLKKRFHSRPRKCGLYLVTKEPVKQLLHCHSLAKY